VGEQEDAKAEEARQEEETARQELLAEVDRALLASGQPAALPVLPDRWECVGVNPLTSSRPVSMR
jgi:hypothetical protein